MLDRLLAMLIDMKTREEGQAMVEYALILTFVAAVAVRALTTGVAGDLSQDIKAAVEGVL